MQLSDRTTRFGGDSFTAPVSRDLAIQSARASVRACVAGAVGVRGAPQRREI